MSLVVMLPGEIQIHEGSRWKDSASCTFFSGAQNQTPSKFFDRRKSCNAGSIYMQKHYYYYFYFMSSGVQVVFIVETFPSLFPKFILVTVNLQMRANIVGLSFSKCDVQVSLYLIVPLNPKYKMDCTYMSTAPFNVAFCQKTMS